jgi:hypothetical protein
MFPQVEENYLPFNKSQPLQAQPRQYQSKNSVRIDRLDYMATNPYHALDSDLSISPIPTTCSNLAHQHNRFNEQGKNKKEGTTDLKAIKPSTYAQDSGTGLAANAGTQIDLHSFMNTPV